MKKIFALVIVITFALVLFTPVANADPIQKLKEGAKELATAPLALGQGPATYIEEVDYKPLGVVAGIFAGAGQFLQKGISGFVKVLTFPFDPLGC